MWKFTSKIAKYAIIITQMQFAIYLSTDLEAFKVAVILSVNTLINT